jgi:hypothetical protein
MADKGRRREFCCISITTIAYAKWRFVNWQRTIDASYHSVLEVRATVTVSYTDATNESRVIGEYSS